MILTTTGTTATVTIVGLRNSDNNDVVLTHPQTINLLEFYDEEDIQSVIGSIQSEIAAGRVTAQTQDGDSITDANEVFEDTSQLSADIDALELDQAAQDITIGLNQTAAAQAQAEVDAAEAVNASQQDEIDALQALPAPWQPHYVSVVNTTGLISDDSSSFKTVDTLAGTIPAGKGGTYLVKAYYVWSHDSTGSDIRAHLRSGSTVLVKEHTQEPQDSSGSDGTSIPYFDSGSSTAGTNQKFHNIIEDEVTLAAGASYSYNFRFTTSNGNKSTIHFLRISLERKN